MCPRRTPRRRRGAALVEFAIVLPLILIFLIALIEIGRGLMTTSLLTEAARAGCRAGVLPAATNSQVNAAVTGKTKNLGFTAPTVKIFVKGKEGDVTTATTGDEVRVQVTVAYSQVSWLPFTRWMGGNLMGRYALARE